LYNRLVADPIDDALARLRGESSFDAGGAENELRDHPDKPRVAAALAAALRERTWPEEARRRAIRVLGSLPGDEAAQAVLAAARSPEKSLRAAAALALERAPDGPKVEDALLSMLKDPAAAVRAGAASSLSRRKPGPRVLPALARALAASADQTVAENRRPADEVSAEIRRDQRDVLRALEPLYASPGYAEALGPFAALLREIADDPAADDPAAQLDAADWAGRALEALERARKGA
jgi:HEAT repeat protein